MSQCEYGARQVGQHPRLPERRPHDSRVDRQKSVSFAHTTYSHPAPHSLRRRPLPAVVAHSADDLLCSVTGLMCSCAAAPLYRWLVDDWGEKNPTKMAELRELVKSASHRTPSPELSEDGLAPYLSIIRPYTDLLYLLSVSCWVANNSKWLRPTSAPSSSVFHLATLFHLRNLPFLSLATLCESPLFAPTVADHTASGASSSAQTSSLALRVVEDAGTWLSAGKASAVEDVLLLQLLLTFSPRSFIISCGLPELQSTLLAQSQQPKQYLRKLRDVEASVMDLYKLHSAPLDKASELLGVKLDLTRPHSPTESFYLYIAALLPKLQLALERLLQCSRNVLRMRVWLRCSYELLSLRRRVLSPTDEEGAASSTPLDLFLHESYATLQTKPSPKERQQLGQQLLQLMPSLGTSEQPLAWMVDAAEQAGVPVQLLSLCHELNERSAGDNSDHAESSSRASQPPPPTPPTADEGKMSVAASHPSVHVARGIDNTPSAAARAQPGPAVDPLSSAAATDYNQATPFLPTGLNTATTFSCADTSSTSASSDTGPHIVRSRDSSDNPLFTCSACGWTFRDHSTNAHQHLKKRHHVSRAPVLQDGRWTFRKTRGKRSAQKQPQQPQPQHAQHFGSLPPPASATATPSPDPSEPRQLPTTQAVFAASSIPPLTPSLLSSSAKKSSCHQCKVARPVDQLMYCANNSLHGAINHKRRYNIRGRQCRKKFCVACLWHYGEEHSREESVLSATESVWECPWCAGVCVCKACVEKKQGKVAVTVSPATSSSSSSAAAATMKVKKEKAEARASTASSDDKPTKKRTRRSTVAARPTSHIDRSWAGLRKLEDKFDDIVDYLVACRPCKLVWRRTSALSSTASDSTSKTTHKKVKLSHTNDSDSDDKLRQRFAQLAGLVAVIGSLFEAHLALRQLEQAELSGKTLCLLSAEQAVGPDRPSDTSVGMLLQRVTDRMTASPSTIVADMRQWACDYRRNASIVDGMQLQLQLDMLYTDSCAEKCVAQSATRSSAQPAANVVDSAHAAPNPWLTVAAVVGNSDIVTWARQNQPETESDGWSWFDQHNAFLDVRQKVVQAANECARILVISEQERDEDSPGNSPRAVSPPSTTCAASSHFPSSSSAASIPRLFAGHDSNGKEEKDESDDEFE